MIVIKYISNIDCNFTQHPTNIYNNKENFNKRQNFLR